MPAYGNKLVQSIILPELQLRTKSQFFRQPVEESRRFIAAVTRSHSEGVLIRRVAHPIPSPQPLFLSDEIFPHRHFMMVPLKSNIHRC